MSCIGNGTCMNVCTYRGNCIHQHITAGFTFCKPECKNQCELIPCKNSTHCNSAFPAYFYKEKNSFITNGACNMCGILDITFLKEKRECFICSKIKYMIVTKCHHEMCYDCLMEIEGKDVHCPFCQTNIECPI